jgi:hypothetical protein
MGKPVSNPSYRPVLGRLLVSATLSDALRRGVRAQLAHLVRVGEHLPANSGGQLGSFPLDTINSRNRSCPPLDLTLRPRDAEHGSRNGLTWSYLCNLQPDLSIIAFLLQFNDLESAVMTFSSNPAQPMEHQPSLG